jgi:hypothetical protein
MAAVYGSAFAIGPGVGLLVFILFTCGVVLVLSGNRPVYVILLLSFLMGLLLSAMLMPSLGHSKGKSPGEHRKPVPSIFSSARPWVHSRLLTLGARDAGGTVGLVADERLRSVHQCGACGDRLRKSWLDLRCRKALSRRSSHRQISLVHPLSFTFQSPEPVYPMRLTGVDAQPVSVELYVFGPDYCLGRRLQE